MFHKNWLWKTWKSRKRAVPNTCDGIGKNAFKTMKQNELREYMENKAEANYRFEGIIYGYGPPNPVS